MLGGCRIAGLSGREHPPPSPSVWLPCECLLLPCSPSPAGTLQETSQAGSNVDLGEEGSFLWSCYVQRLDVPGPRRPGPAWPQNKPQGTEAPTGADGGSALHSTLLTWQGLQEVPWPLLSLSTLLRSSLPLTLGSVSPPHPARPQPRAHTYFSLPPSCIHWDAQLSPIPDPEQAVHVCGRKGELAGLEPAGCSGMPWWHDKAWL